MCSLAGCTGCGNQTLDTLVYRLSKLGTMGVGVVLVDSHIDLCKHPAKLSARVRRCPTRHSCILSASATPAGVRTSRRPTRTAMRIRTAPVCRSYPQRRHRGLPGPAGRIHELRHTFMPGTDTEVVLNLVEAAPEAVLLLRTAFTRPTGWYEGSHAVLCYYHRWL